MTKRSPLVTDPERSALMKRIRRSGTEPENQVAAILRAMGIRSRRNVKGLPGTPDFANKARLLAIFVHGCFWHGHVGCKLARVPKRNAAFWESKLAANRARDRRKVRELRHLGFKVITVWSCHPERLRRLIS